MGIKDNIANPTRPAKNSKLMFGISSKPSPAITVLFKPLPIRAYTAAPGIIPKKLAKK